MLRPSRLALGLSIGMAIGGAYLAFRAPKAEPDALTRSGIDLNQPKHPVTKQMEMETAAMSNARVPKVTLADGYGTSVNFGEQTAARPQLILFIKHGCPCSIEAQPIFNMVYKQFSKEVEFVGVIDVKPDKAKEYATQFQVPFPVVSDSEYKLIRPLQAKAAVYSALVARNGHLIKLWPGYSVDMLKEIHEKIAQAAAVPEPKLDLMWTPKIKTSGCTFEIEW